MPAPALTAAAGTIIPVSSLITPGGQIGYTGPMGDGQPVGTVYAFTSVTPPAGSMIADGSAISRTTYPALFAVIGTTYGAGDGSTTFNIPDLRSKFILGNGQGTGLSNRVIATTGGEENHVLSVAELANHAHGLGGHTHGMDHYHNIGAGGWHGHGLGGHTHGCGQPSSINYGTTNPGYAFYQCAGSNTGGPSGGSDGANTGAWNTVYASQTSGSWANTGGPSGGSDAAGSSSGHNTMPPYLVLVYMIKVAAGGGPSAQAPLADTTQPGLLCKVSGLNTDYIRGDNTVQSLASGIVTVAPNWRSYNSLGNPNFEIDVRTGGAGTTTNSWAQDRWYGYQQASPLTGKWAQVVGNVIVAGTSFCVSQNFLRFTLTGQKASLAATDYIFTQQWVEGPRLRELVGGPSSVSIVCRSTVAPLTFTVGMRDNPAAYTLLFAATLSNANAWTLIPLPNWPVFTASGSFPLGSGNNASLFSVCLAAGSQFIGPSTGSWVAGNFLAAPGTTNFAAQAVNSTFDIGFIQHEPLATPSGILDKDFQTNERECWRYYIDTRDGNYTELIFAGGQPYCFNPKDFPVRMAKVPTVTIYGSAVNHTGEHINGADHTISSLVGASRTGWGYAQTNVNYSYPPWISGYIADTGW